MDKRLDASRSGYREDISSHSKKTKKRSSRRSSAFGPWTNNTQNSQNNDIPSGVEYQHVLWQSNVQQNFPNNGQRLFATTSDPSMCGYGQLPMTYTMEPVSLPAMYRLYQPVPMSGVRTVHGRPRRYYNQNHPMNLGMNSVANGYSSLQENGLESPIPVNYQNGDYASLPPTANKNNGINGDELASEHRRYSDPGLGSAEAPVHTQSEDSDSLESGSSITTIGRSNKLVLSLIEQMTELKKSSSQLFKELNETKSELGSMKAKLAQCKYSTSSDYQPGMLSDLIREIRQANKACEEGLVANVKSIVEEKLNQRSLEVVNLNNQILKLTEAKEESERRIAKLEEEVATLKLNANNEGREIAAFEEETLALRRELQEARASKTLAENHVAKCVNARSVTPVSFETPYVTSTPVRTALSDTCSLVPALVVASSTTITTTTTTTNTTTTTTTTATATSTSASTNFTSFLHSRNAELAHHFIPEKPSLYRIADCSLASVDAWTVDDNRGPVSSTQSPNDLDREDGTLEEICSPTVVDNKAENSGQEEEVTDAKANEDNVDRVYQTNEEEVRTEDDKVDPTRCKKEVNEETIMARGPEKRVKGCSRNEPVKKEDETMRGQKGASKKSRKKKGNATKRSLNEAGKSSSEVANGTAAKDGGSWRTVSEDEDRLDDDETSRAITEIPEVTVVGGGSFISKDLCSTGILTSRVLTAPSRATYTTAYI